MKQKKYSLYCDSQSAIHLCKNSTFHSRSKHIDMRYYWIREVLDFKFLTLEKVHFNDNVADMLTKALPKEKLLFSRQEVDLTIPPNELEGEIVGCGPAHL